MIIVKINIKNILNYIMAKKNNQINNKLKIYICAHKKFDKSIIPYQKDCYEIIYKDKCNNNLNDLKYFYSELYQIYEILHNKDINKYEYIGICHYRRFFDITIEEIIDLMNNYDCIVSEPLQLNASIYEQYNRCFGNNFGGTHIKEIGSIIKHNYSDYFKTFIDVMNSNCFDKFHLCNMSIMKTENFIEYYNMIFDILNKFIEKHNWKEYKDIYEYVENNKQYIPNMSNNSIDDYFKTIEYYIRIGGHISERLMNMYIYKNFKNIKTVPLKIIN